MALVGIDLIEIKRIEKSMNSPRFCKKLMGQTEFALLQKRGFPIQSVATSFCAKEAFSKAIGLGIGIVKWDEIELLRKENGVPYLKLSGNALKIATELNCEFTVSATHTKQYASVVVIGEKIRNE